MSLIATQVTVSATAAALPNNSILTSVILTAPSTNTGIVYIGNSAAVTSSTGYPLEKGESIELPIRGGNTANIFIVGTASDKLGVAGA